MTQEILEKIAELRRISEENKGALARAMSRLTTPEAQARAAERQRILYGHDDRAICNLIIEEMLGLAKNTARYGNFSVRWFWTSSDSAMNLVQEELLALSLSVEMKSVQLNDHHRVVCGERLCNRYLFSFTLVMSW